ncbi:MAG: ABC transporter permease [Enterococcaceae bacterium]|jgi:ABC-2 type transport system permease protein|nr:ABC transporter permease [Enterococcaceae bacterium]
MGGLMVNEWSKLWRKKTAWIFLLLLIAAAFGSAGLFHETGSSSLTGVRFFSELAQMIPLMNFFLVLLMAGMVAEEFRLGTIRLLAISPKGRAKIVLAKFFTMICTALLFSAALLAASYGAACLFFGTFSFLEPLSFSIAVPSIKIAVSYLLLNLFAAGTYLSVTLGIAFWSGTAGVAAGVGTMFVFGASWINSFMNLLSEKISFFKWNPFNLFNLRSAYQARFLPAEDRHQFSLNADQMATGLLIYTILFIVLAIIIFSEKDFDKNKS